MKKSTILILSIGISFSMLAQKKELKNVEKLIKASDFSGATEGLQGLEAMVLDTKYESYYYFLEGKTAFGDDKTKDYVKAVKYFYKTLEVEQRIKDDSYSEKSISYLNTISDYYYKVINKALKEENYKKAGDVYETLYKMNPQRKDLLENAYQCRLNSKEYAEASVMAEKLLELTKNKVLYGAVNKHTSKNNEFFTKEARDEAVKIATHFAPSESDIDKKIRLGYYNALVAIYQQSNDSEKEMNILKKAIKEYPDHAVFYESYAAAVYRTGDKEAYVTALENTLKLTPENKGLWYNLGVVSHDVGQTEKALFAYNKVIELDPTYRNAYINKGFLVLSQEKALIKELNKNAGTKNYAVIKKQITDLYEKAIPLLEKAYSLEKDNEVKSTLKGLYEAVGNTEKAKALE